MPREKNDTLGTLSGVDATIDPSASSTGANSAGTATSKAAVARAPQKRVLHIFYKAETGADGQPALAIVKVLSDARKVVEFMDSDEYAGLKRYKYEVVSEPRGSKDGEVAEA